MWSSATGFFHLAQCFQGLSTLYHVFLVLHCFLLLNYISLYGYNTCLSIHQVMEIWTVSILWSLWLMLLWTYVFKFSIWKNFQIVFQSCCTIVHSHQQYSRVPISPHSHQLLWTECLVPPAPNLYVETLTPKVTIFGDRVCEEVNDVISVGPSSDRISALIKRWDTRALSPYALHEEEAIWAHSRIVAI